jgi:hypothetical protein
LYTEWRRFYIWVEPKPELSKVRKEQLFVQMLEGIHWKEAEVVCLAKDKKLHTRYKSLNEKLVRAAFPQLLPPPAPKPVQKQKEEVEVKKDGGPSSVDS